MLGRGEKRGKKPPTPYNLNMSLWHTVCEALLVPGLLWARERLPAMAIRQDTLASRPCCSDTLASSLSFKSHPQLGTAEVPMMASLCSLLTFCSLLR